MGEMRTDERLAVLIDADNVSAGQAAAIFETACQLGQPIVRRAYGMVHCFSSKGGWSSVQREYGILAKPQVSNTHGKNVADIALVIDAMEILYKGVCEGICIVSSDGDYTGLAAKIREGGKLVYGIGGEKTPESFRAACTRFIELRTARKMAIPAKTAAAKACPRCGAPLEVAHTKSRQTCHACAACGGMTTKLVSLRRTFDAESLAQVVARAKAHEVPGCVCPDCGASMSLVAVKVGSRKVDLDVCGCCQSVWYDRDEFEALVPADGLLRATVSAGKAFRREMALLLTSDLRSGRCTAHDVGALKTILKKVYFVPNPDIQPIIDTLRCQKIVAIDKKGVVTVLKG